MDSFKGKIKPKGMVLSRSKAAYEQSDEYRERIAKGSLLILLKHRGIRLPQGN